MSTILDDVTPEADTLTAPPKTEQITEQVALTEKVTLHRAKKRKPSAKAAAREDKHVTGEEKRSRIASGVDWPIAIWIGVIHVGALAAPFTFSWEGLGTFLFLSWLTGSIGICMTFHRMLTHRSFKT